MTMSAQQPSWSIPTPDKKEPVLKIYNSLTKTKTEFIPRNGRMVNWYSCGPTIYDASHMGHARYYITQDVLHRMMSDYFHYDVHSVMNIVDINDKKHYPVEDPAIQRTQVTHWEAKVFDVMSRLHVRKPDTTTRLTCDVDVESGGIDLAVLPHDLKVGQLETYHKSAPRVNYCVHIGHLNIENQPINKSVKNDVAIEDVLEKYTARQLRLAFLTQVSSVDINFSGSLITGEVRDIEITFDNFFADVKALATRYVTDGTPSDGSKKVKDSEKKLQVRLYESQANFRDALCDSFNTPMALKILREMVSATYFYIDQCKPSVNVALVECVACWVGRMLRMFGLGEGDKNEIGWGQDDNGESAIGEIVAVPYLRKISSFRDGVKKIAMKGGETALMDILALSETLRDIELVL